MTAPAATAEASGAVVEMGSGRLRAYGLWQMRDYLITKGIGTVLVLGLMLFLTWTAIAEARAELISQFGDTQGLAPFLHRMFAEFMDKLVLFGVLFATNGIVSEDRKFGYYRFYFAKPVTVAGFYGQKFIVHMLGLVLIAGLMLGAHALAIAPIYPRAFFPVFAMVIVGLAGIGFLISALFTLDWISLFAVYGAAIIGWSLYEDDRGIRGLLVRALPPVHELTDVYAAVAADQAIPMQPLWWVFVYGLVCFFLGLVVISRRRLATN